MPPNGHVSLWMEEAQVSPEAPEAEHDEHDEDDGGRHIAGGSVVRERGRCEPAKFESKFYKDLPLFSTYAKETAANAADRALRAGGHRDRPAAAAVPDAGEPD